MIVKARYENGTLILLEDLPHLEDGQEVWVNIETSPRSSLPTSAMIITLTDHDNTALMPPMQPALIPPLTLDGDMPPE